MEKQLSGLDHKFNGYDALWSSPPEKLELGPEAFDDWTVHHPVYDEYQRMHKVMVGPSGGGQLERIAYQLGGEHTPRYLNAAAWAAVESSLVRPAMSSVRRIDLIETAEGWWQKALKNQRSIEADDDYEAVQGDSEAYRIARNLAFSPLMKAIVVGNVTKRLMEQVYVDTLALSQASRLQMAFADKQGDDPAIKDHVGLLHENNALLAILHQKDSRYVPLPSSERAGSGYYYPRDTHDISIVNQHWGAIRKVIPTEIKASASRSDRDRYKALLVRGKMHLSIGGHYHDPAHTLDAYINTYEGVASDHEQATVEHVTSTIKELIALYQKGKKTKINSPTSFHSKDKLIDKYREVTPSSRS